MEFLEQASTQVILFYVLYGITGAVPFIAALYLLLCRSNFDYTWNDDINMARELVIDFGNGEEVTTRIDDVKVDDTIGNRRVLDLDGIFNLNGQRLDAPQKGINIINGKKVVIK